MTRTAILLLSLFTALTPLAAQAGDEKPADETPRTAEQIAAEKRAEALLREVDSRIWYGGREGIEDIQFDWKIEAHGAIADVLDGYYLRYAWKKPDLWITGLVDRDGKDAAPPKAFENESGRAILHSLSENLNALARQVIVGIPLEELYADYRKEVRSREVNNKLEHRVIMRPLAKKRYTEVSVRIIDGLPRELKKTTPEGEVVVIRLLFEKRGEKYLMTSAKFEERNRLVSQDVYRYTKRDDLHLLASVERLIDQAEAERLQQPVKQVLRLERVRVNSGLRDEQFGVTPAEEKKPAEGGEKGEGTPAPEKRDQDDEAGKKGD
ncbi:MAG: hypothetical protein R3F20_05915 [Planctomycetota bacterium]